MLETLEKIFLLHISNSVFTKFTKATWEHIPTYNLPQKKKKSFFHLKNIQDFPGHGLSWSQNTREILQN